MSARTLPLCPDCHQPIWPNQQRARNRHLACAARVSPAAAASSRCGAWMPVAGTGCARGPRHRGYHRSRYALDNEALARSGKRPRLAIAS